MKPKPQCPVCGDPSVKQGHQTNGSQKYRCTSTPAHHFSDSTGGSVGRPRITNPSPAAVKKREQRAKKKELGL